MGYNYPQNQRLMILFCGGRFMSKDLVENKLKAEARILSFSRAAPKRRLVKSVSITDADTGEILKESSSAQVHQNGSGFVISYTEKMCEFLQKVAQGSVVRIFLYIAHHQNYGNDGIYGFRCTHRHLREALNLNRKTVYEALQYLFDNYLIVENRFCGSPEFMVNPDYVTIGTDKRLVNVSGLNGGRCTSRISNG